MQTRKVQLVGGSTFAVSLPKSWAVPAGLKTGDEVLFEPQPDGTLTLRPQRSDATRIVERRVLHVHGLSPEQVERRVTALYLAGTDAIEIIGAGPLDARLVERIGSLPRRISGLELVEQAPQRIVLQDMLEPRDFDVPKAFERTYALASGMHREVLAGLSDHAAARLDAVAGRQEDVDRLCWVATKQLRTLVKAPGPDPARWDVARDALAFAAGINLVQRFGQYGVRLSTSARNVLGRPADPRVVPSLVEVGTRALQICDVAARAFGKADLAAADDALARVQPFEERVAELQRFSASRAITCGACDPCLGTIQVLEWLHASVGVGVRFAELASQRAVTRQASEGDSG